MKITRSGIILIAAIGVAGCGRATLPKEEEQPSPNSVSSDAWKSQVVSQTEELFAGRFAGVSVYRVDGGIRVLIRGATSVTADTQPLYVIDGMPIEAGPGGALTGINPADIEKIEVLKDVSSTSLYGVRGANGVILITTKRAK